MKMKQIYTLLGLTLSLSINHLCSDQTQTDKDYTFCKAKQTEQEVLASLLTAIEEDDIEIIDACLDQYPLHINHLFEKNIYLDPRNGGTQNTFTINPLILAIVLGKIGAVKALIAHGAECNKKIHEILPFIFTTSIPDEKIRKKMMLFLIEAGAIGHTPTDLFKCTYIIEELCKNKWLKSHPEEIISHHLFSHVIEILEKNPYVLFSNIVITVEREQAINSTTLTMKVINLLKTAILVDLPWLASFFIAIKKMLRPQVNAVDLKLSDYFNIMDYLSFDQNKEMLALFLEEKPLISNYLMHDNTWMKKKLSTKCYDLYMNQSHAIPMDLDDPENPCITQKLLPKVYFSAETAKYEREVLEPEIITTLFSLFNLIENEEEFLDENEQIEVIQTILKNIKNPEHLNILQVTTERILTTKGYKIEKCYETLLSTAIKKENLALVKIFVEAGADVNQGLIQQIHLMPITTLHYAAIEESAEIVSYLLEKGAMITPLVKDDLAAFNQDIRAVLEEYMHEKKEVEQMQEVLVEPLSHKRNRDADAPTLLSPAIKRIREN